MRIFQYIYTGGGWVHRRVGGGVAVGPTGGWVGFKTGGRRDCSGPNGGLGGFLDGWAAGLQWAMRRGGKGKNPI